ncbi:unnamed protein product, partial [Amoebophrya sp. A120]|eukprot:GSA120T00003040001.1
MRAIVSELRDVVTGWPHLLSSIRTEIRRDRERTLDNHKDNMNHLLHLHGKKQNSKYKLTRPALFTPNLRFLQGSPSSRSRSPTNRAGRSLSPSPVSSSGGGPRHRGLKQPVVLQSPVVSARSTGDDVRGQQAIPTAPQIDEEL